MLLMRLTSALRTQVVSHLRDRKTCHVIIGLLNNTLGQMDLMFHPKAEKYPLFSNAHRTLSRVDHMLGHEKEAS